MNLEAAVMGGDNRASITARRYSRCTFGSILFIEAGAMTSAGPRHADSGQKHRSDYVTRLPKPAR